MSQQPTFGKSPNRNQHGHGRRHYEQTSNVHVHHDHNPTWHSSIFDGEYETNHGKGFEELRNGIANANVTPSYFKNNLESMHYEQRTQKRMQKGRDSDSRNYSVNTVDNIGNNTGNDMDKNEQRKSTPKPLKINMRWRDDPK
jgi:hypothetical protein